MMKQYVKPEVQITDFSSETVVLLAVSDVSTYKINTFENDIFKSRII